MKFEITSGFRQISASSLSISLLFIILHSSASLAANWENMARTGRHHVLFDAASAKITSSGKRAVWLAFRPTGEVQRRQAAVEYNNKKYRSHLEYYEIECSENSAVLGRIFIIGNNGKRIAQLKPDALPEIIIPGSVLDLVFQRVCPAPDNDLSDETENIEKPATSDDQTQSTSPEMLNRIAESLDRTETEPDKKDAWAELGNAYYDADMPHEAIAAYDKALTIAPDDADVLNDQGAMFRQTGDLSRALKNFEKSLQIAPNNSETLYNLGYIHAFDLNRFDLAKEYWHRFLALDGSSETAVQVRLFIDRYGR